MRYAVIAAGAGSRLSNEGIGVPKPLVDVGGECLIDRLVRIFMANDADDIVVVCNEGMPSVAAHLLSLCRHGLHGRQLPLRYVERSTPSSMHSLYELRAMLRGAPFVLTTVDTVFDASEFGRYVAAFRAGHGCLMGVTEYVADESPLYVDVSADMTVAGFYDRSPVCRHVSAGIYGLQPSALAVLEGCVARGESRMRNFQRALLAAGEPVGAFAFSRVLDIDHASDVAQARRWLNERVII